MPIPVGEVTVVADKSFDVYSVTITKQSGEWRMYIEYAVIIGEERRDKKVILAGEEYNTFYEAWLSGKQIVDKVLEVEGVVLNIEEPDAEAEFMNEVEEPVEEQ